MIDPRRPRHRRTLPAIPLLLACSGCFTEMLWAPADDRWRSPSVESIETVDGEQWQQAGELQVCDDHLCWRRGADAADGERSDEAAGGAAFVLVPGEQGDAALLLLRDAGLTQQMTATLRTEAVLLDGELRRDDTALLLQWRWNLSAIATIVDEAALPAETQRALSNARRPSLRDLDPAGNPLPVRQQRAALALLAIDLRQLTGAGEPQQIESFVFVDGDDRPLAFAAGDEATQSAPVMLLLRVAGAHGAVTMRLDGERMLQLASLGSTRGSGRLRSSWSALDADASPPARVEAARCLPATWSVREVRQRTLTSADLEHSQLTLWEKIALTPFTVTLDLLFGWVGAVLHLDDDEHDDGRRRDRGAARRDRTTGSDLQSPPQSAGGQHQHHRHYCDRR